MKTGYAACYGFFQGWWFLICLTGLATFIAYDQDYLARMVEADRSSISLAIIAAFIAASAHAAWHIFLVSRRIEAARMRLAQTTIMAHGAREDPQERLRLELPEHFINRYIAKISTHLRADNGEHAAGEAALVLDVYADRLRNPSETGWYLVDILIRLGLIGTIVGFVIVLGTLADGPPPTSDTIQGLLIGMSGGMGTALYTTLSGLLCASVLGAQHMILSRASEHLIALLIDLKSRMLKEGCPS